MIGGSMEDLVDGVGRRVRVKVWDSVGGAWYEAALDVVVMWAPDGGRVVVVELGGKVTTIKKGELGESQQR
ncbi:hypothetical protein V6N13_130017 [Hibiscus sabdariffa]